MRVLTLWAGQAESLCDEALAIEVRELPEDLAALDRLLACRELLEPIVAHGAARSSRPETYVRLMVLKGAPRLGVADIGGRGFGTRSTCGASAGSR